MGKSNLLGLLAYQEKLLKVLQKSQIEVSLCENITEVQGAIIGSMQELLLLSSEIIRTTSSSGTETGDSQSPITKPGSSRPKSTLGEPPGLDVRSTGGSSEIELDS